MSDSSSERNPVEELAEEFLDRYRSGERPALSEYTSRFPELADEIRDLFPALVMMEDVRPDAGDVTGDLEPRPAGGPKLERLGDYRIIREVGHGGMGIVYEAEQESLGRHVALKVLLTHSLLDPKQFQRFHREARAAARLHHTNIVPVYGVGEQDGFHYYIMQFIQGQGLDQVLAELKRLQQIQGGQPVEESVGPVAQGLLTGCFTAPGQNASLEGSEPRPPGSGGVPQAVDSASSSTIHLPGQAEHSALTHSSRQYFQSVARIGVQVAEALSYAHSQGILHRDIKPSNLLLDTQGTVWVTDFGLAKAAADGDLTHTGDIVGTLRYMAPERFNGQSDLRSDLYSLGLTLYELLTLRPGFDEPNRNKLIQHVMHDEPPRPRKLNGAVPRDLETIVLKTIARDPAQRYQTPTELADDLRRFVEDRPIRARRAGAGERLWRWCRRNPALAGLMAIVQVALLSLLALGTWSHARISQALAEKNRALTDTEEARDTAVAVSYRALLNETQALRLAHASGWRSKALENLQKLARLETPQRDLVELRSEAVACLGGFDANEETRLLGHTESVWSLDFSPDGSLLATAGYDGRLQLWDIKERRSVREVLDSGVNLAIRHNLAAPLPAVRFHPDGNSLAFATWKPGFGVLTVKGEARDPVHVPFQAWARYLAFDKKGQQMAVSWGDGRVGLYDARTRKLRREIKTGVGGNFYFPVALSPDGEWLATMGPQNTVQVYSVAGDKRELVFLGRHRSAVRSLCFSPSGRLLASASEDQTVKLWQVSGNEEPITLLGHTARVQCVAFSPDGSLLASASDDETVRLWETRTGQALMVLHPRVGAALSVAFSPDGRRLAVGGALPGRVPVCLYQLTSRQEQRRLAGHTYIVHALAFHPSQPLLASGGGDRSIFLWDLQTGRQAQRWYEMQNNPIYRVAFAPEGDLLAEGVTTYSTASGNDFSIRLRETQTGKIQRHLHGPGKEINDLTFAPSGLLAAVTIDGSGFVWKARTGETLDRWKSAGSLLSVAFLRGGTRLVMGTAGGRVAVRDSSEHRDVQQVEVPGGLACLAVAPDERTLAVGSDNGILRILALPGLETLATLEQAHAGRVQTVAFSPDGRLLATGGPTDLRVILWDARTRQRLCILPQSSQINNVAFDPSGRHLAICGSETLVTVWDLGLVNEELAEAGLDWDASLPRTGLLPGALVDAQPPAVTTVEAPRRPVPATGPGAGGGAKPSVIVQPASRRRRTATAKEIITWVTQLTDAKEKVRQAAADALVEVGPQAVPALAPLAAADEQLEPRDAARAVLDRIAAAEVLAPTRVSLKLKDALPADAIRALSEQSRIPMTYQPPTDGQAPQRISLDLEDVCVWEALDRISAAGHLSNLLSQDGTVVCTIVPASPPPAVRRYAGPFRLHPTSASLARNVTFSVPTPKTEESVRLQLLLLTEPCRELLSCQSTVRVTEALTVDGQSLVPSPVPGVNTPLPMTGGLQTVGLTVPLKGPQKRSDRLRVLKGVLGLEIMVRRHDLVTVPDLASASGRTFWGAQGHRLTVEQVQTRKGVGPGNGEFRTARFRGADPPGQHPESILKGVDLTDARGRYQRIPNSGVFPQVSLEPQPEDLAWLAPAPQVPSLAALPWPALALPGSHQGRSAGLVWLQVSTPVPFENPVQLRYFQYERMKVDLPFELHDVPLP
jgi:WD40 repeat protein/serine/threonine protein kinase